MKVLHPSLNCFSHILPFLASCTVFDKKTRDSPGRARNVLHPGAFNVPPGLVENESYELP